MFEVNLEKEGLEEATRKVKNLANSLEHLTYISPALLESGKLIQGRLNEEVEGYQTEVYMVSKKEVHVAPSEVRIIEYLKSKEEEILDASKRCRYLFYLRYIEPEDRRPLDIVEIDPMRVRAIVTILIPTIKEIMISSVKEGLK